MPFAPQETRTYFVTAVTASGRRLFQVDQNARLFLDHLSQQRTKNRMQIHAFVVMPDHVHLLLTPAFAVSLEKAMQFIKGGFSFLLKSKMDVWERSFDSRQIPDLHAFQACVGYIHHNPCKESLSPAPGLYPHSSASAGQSFDPMPAHFNSPSVFRG